METNTNTDFNVIVVGGGHSGIEAAASSARMGAKVLLITLSESNIGHMPCNPAIGGIGKGHIVFEIEALGGVMPKLCSLSYLQCNMLNKSKGPAVQGLRLQIDKNEYKKQALIEIKKYTNITIIYDKVTDFIIKKNTITGVKTESEKQFFATSVILTSGTFLNGVMHIGACKTEGGRENEKNVKHLSDKIRNLGINLGKLKTGTPPRLDAKSINTSILEKHESHNLEGLFQYEAEKITHKKSCFITHTNKQTHQIILDNAHLSPIYKGEIQGMGARYCPSIEDKVKRFFQKESHHIFIEPEGLSSNEIYPNGISTSLPLEIQEKFLHTIRGCEQAIITKPGYAIEYDFVYPNQLKHTLESKNICGLFFAGQINGTTGYEEAAGQGIMAGINAAAKALHNDPLILSRTESYIGVMIDDLITLGTDEPYRMFTSRAERRLSLRQDNAFYRLNPYAYKYKLISAEKNKIIASEHQRSREIIQELKKDQKRISALLSENKYEEAKKLIFSLHNSLSFRMREFIFAELLYSPYYQRENSEIKKTKEYEKLTIPKNFSYKDIPGLSHELQEKLEKYRPNTISQASLIQGITPSAISLLIFKVKNSINYSK